MEADHWVVIAVALFVGAVALAVAYRHYRRWAPRLWKQHILDRQADLRGRLDLNEPEGQYLQSQAKRLESEFRKRHLQTFPVERLDNYPGIGTGTIGRVRAAGGRTLAELVSFPFESITGIGPSKAGVLRAAVKDLLHDAQSEFDAGSFPEADEYRKRVEEVMAHVRDLVAARARVRAEVEAALRAVNELLAMARPVTFVNYLFRRHAVRIPEEVMNRPLPQAEMAPLLPLIVNPPAPAVAGGRPAAFPSPMAAVFPPAGQALAAPTSGDIFADELRDNAGAAGGNSESHPRLPKLVAYTRFAFAVAKADGRVAVAEKKVIRSFLEEQFGHDPVLVRHIDPLMERTEGRVPSEADALADVQSVTTAADQLDLYRFAERIADASGERNQRERDLLGRLAAAFGVTAVAPTPSPVAPPQPVPPQFDPRAALEIDPGTDVTPDLIRRRYALLSDKLCPTKAAALGPEFAHMAAEKRGRLRAASEALLAPFGEPIDKPAPPPPTDMRHNPDLDAVFGG